MKALKIGCLSCLLIIGIIFLITFILFFMTSASASLQNQTPFEVMTKKGMVKLHLGMPKDSVILLIGKPDNRTSQSIGNTIEEEIGYKVKNDVIEDLTFTFEDGRLKSFTQE